LLYQYKSTNTDTCGAALATPAAPSAWKVVYARDSSLPKRKNERETLSLVCDTRTVAHFTLEQLLDYYFTFFDSEQCTTYPRTSFRIVPKRCIASEPRTARPLGVFWGHRDSKFSENSLQALTRFKLSAIPTATAQLRQYLYFCTSKASKRSTWNYLPST
jgi:hypothetical protein